MNLSVLSDAFAQSSSNNSALQNQRASALDALLESGFPTRRDELWKYTRSDALADFAIEAVAADTKGETANTTARIETALANVNATCQLVFVDGQLDSDRTKLPQGLSLDADVAADSAGEFDGRAHALLLMNSALPTADLTLSTSTDTVIDEPLHIVHIDSGSRRLAQVRMTLAIASGSALTINEQFLSVGETAHMNNQAIHAQLGADAQLRLHRLQQLNQDALQVTRIEATLEERASLSAFTLDIGSQLTRNDLNVRLEGAESQVDMRGIYLGDGAQHIDNHTRVDHVARDTRSNEDYRGILRDQCRAVFNGKVMVHVGADGTDATQSNPNLLLSDHAEIDTKPELEIYADDVKCAHGATVGQIDDKSLFYLRSRGIDQDTAMQLLTYAFCRETLDEIDDDALRIRIEQMIADQIPDFSALELIA
ncbi:MAG: Fe-S cluster assembly protein SufD [Pseudomonadota bacterium]